MKGTKLAVTRGSDRGGAMKGTKLAVTRRSDRGGSMKGTQLAAIRGAPGATGTTAGDGR